MTAITDHKCFNQPENLNSKLWRYMDFGKFVSLISKKELFFCRANLFKDSFEGSYSQANSKLHPLVYAKTSSESCLTMERIKEARKFSNSVLANYRRLWTYISCWHANEFESAAMWDLYSAGQVSIAIETNYTKLKNALPDNSYMGMVNYIDYQTEWLPEGNMFYPFMHKRKSFEHENEVRIIILDENIPKNEKGWDLNAKNPKPGIYVPIDFEAIITNIHISPLAPTWIVEAITDVVDKYSIPPNVKKSDLYNNPFK